MTAPRRESYQDETTITKWERARVKFRDKFPEHYAQVEDLIRRETFPATLAWQIRPTEELPKTAQLWLESEMRTAIAGLVKLPA